MDQAEAVRLAVMLIRSAAQGGDEVADKALTKDLTGHDWQSVAAAVIGMFVAHSRGLGVPDATLDQWCAEWLREHPGE